MDLNKRIKKDLEKDLEKNVRYILENPLKNVPSIKEAIEISKRYSVSLHPRYLFYWNEFSVSELVSFLRFVKDSIKIEFDKNKEFSQVVFPINNFKRFFEIIGVEHNVENGCKIVINNLNSCILFANLGIDFREIKSQNDVNLITKQIDKIISYAKNNLSKTCVEILDKNGFVGIRDKGGTYIGARMGRPEKAKMRKQFLDETRSHGLFPVGEDGGRSKNIIEMLDRENIYENFRVYFCSNCKTERLYSKCPVCNQETEEMYFKRYGQIPTSVKDENSVLFKKIKVDTAFIKEELDNILGKNFEYPKSVKGVTKTVNEHHTTEHVVKVILRAKNNVYVNKDGTIRYDMIEMGLTHFKPKEIGTSIFKLKELGYTHDYLGKELIDGNQILEIFPQDIILPDCVQSSEELASDFVINVGNFVDDLLEKLYKIPRYYNFKNKEDTIGHLVVGLAPHTSAGVVGRIIGYSKTQGCFASPLWHAAQRRNLDGDECGIMLLLDGLINFSREFLPNRRGAKTMDAPLVLTSQISLDQIDDEVHNVDISSEYSLEFYKAVKEYKNPKDVKIESIQNRIKCKDIDDRFLGYHFTHDVEDFNDTVLCSAYKSLPSMQEKLDVQLDIAKKIRAVDENKVATLIIEKHFMRDIKGNLRKFSTQSFRCTSCNEKYRRVPLNGVCRKCSKASINFTVHEGSIKKYLNPSLDIISKYKVDSYVAEVIELTKLRVEGVFGVDRQEKR